jgi:hypothetical protein
LFGSLLAAERPEARAAPAGQNYGMEVGCQIVSRSLLRVAQHGYWERRILKPLGQCAAER